MWWHHEAQRQAKGRPGILERHRHCIATESANGKHRLAIRLVDQPQPLEIPGAESQGP
jgi:hypothetical protein